ncbi:hypothetical protein DFP72DRAFT_1072057 [Ephemerocybe angulata]|uniref:Uncharacterized protein n=1 Tax=Ephemerocybe angulata TaxID=980116 RepID=A0A8H6M0H9_9AGAR|nr:hypothetical protein DFP72DRAFT_1072057 [Tulosesus angulatus]
MKARGTELATPNPRAVPPSTVKNVEESRQERLQRQQARIRDRGGIFVPTVRNTLADILCGRREASPKKLRRSRSRSCSPQKPPASPTTGKGKRVSLSSSHAITKGEISVAGDALRRSPRKKSATPQPNGPEAKVVKKGKGGSSKSTVAPSEHAASKSRKTKMTEDEDGEALKTKPAKKDVGANRSKAAAGKQSKASVKKPNAKQGRKVKEDKASQASTSRLSSQAPDSDEEDPPLPSAKSRGRGTKAKPKAPSKSKSKSKEVPSDDDDAPLAPPPKSKPAKRKLSIVQEESEEEKEEVEPAIRMRTLSPVPQPSRKKTKAALPQAEITAGISSKDQVPSKRKQAGEPSERQSGKPRGKGTAFTEPIPEISSKKAKSKHNSLEEPRLEDLEHEIPKKTGTKRKAVMDPEVEADGPSKPKQKRTAPVDAEPVGKKAKTKANASEIPPSNGDHKAEPEPRRKAGTKRKAVVDPEPEEDEQEVIPSKPKAKSKEPSKKKAKTLPLQEVDSPDHSPVGKGNAPKAKKSAVSLKPASQPRTQKENTPLSDSSEGKTANNKSRTVPSATIKGPRKSVMIRIREPLPPVEDNDPDPIDFLS